jgi:predicted MFS family arabinose efflux permease
MLVSVGLLATFVAVERSKERRDAGPLFEFAHLRLKTYRYGLLTGLVLAMGQLGLSFVLPVFLQSARHLTAEQNGLWLLPTGIFVIVGAQVGGRVARALDTTVVVRAGLALYAVGIAFTVWAVRVDVTVWRLLPGLAMYGMGVGFAGAQLTNVVLSQIPRESSGVASGANTTVRQVGSALGVAVIGALLTAQSASHTISRLRAAALPANVKAHAIAGVHALGPNYTPPRGTSAAAQRTVEHTLQSGILFGTRAALTFAMIVVALGAIVSFLIPRRPLAADERPLGAAEGFEPLEPIDPDPALVAD